MAIIKREQFMMEFRKLYKGTTCPELTGFDVRIDEENLKAYESGIRTGTGLSASDIGNVYGVIKAYSSRVGEGPYVTELLDETGDGASVVTLHLPRMSRHRNKRSSANGLSR